MSNTSNKYRKKKMRTLSIVILIIILVGSFIISQKENKVDEAALVDVVTYPITAHVKANPEAELVLIEYSDFQCPACAGTYPVIQSLIDEYGDYFAFEYRHFPLRQPHPNAQIAAQAAEAAGIQGKFWEMHDILFDNQKEWSQSFNPKRYFEDYAEEIGINVDRFALDLESDEVKDRVDSDYAEAQDLSLNSTPSFVVDGEVIGFDDFVNMHLTPAVEGMVR